MPPVLLSYMLLSTFSGICRVQLSMDFSWRAKKQRIVSCSSTEAGHRAVVCTTADIQWLWRLLLDSGVLVQVPICLFCNNISATYLAANPILHNLSKHITFDYHLVRDMVASKRFQIHFIPTQPQVVDIFTTGLSSEKFLQFMANLSVVPCV